MFSHSRTPNLDDLADNAWTAAWEKRLRLNQPTFDLSISNASRVDLPTIVPDQGIIEPAFKLPYQPISQGLGSAREAISEYYQHAITSERIQVFSSTSEAYTAIFKILCAPGDEVIVFSPTYPLLDCLIRLESLELKNIALMDSAGTWEIDFFSLEQAINEKTKALVIVTPNNPTGHCITNEEYEKLLSLCSRKRVALIVDEVFSDYLLESSDESLRECAAAKSKEGLVFSLSGLSKICGLAQHKLAWCALGGDKDLVQEAMERLSYVADATLSCSTWVQAMCPFFIINRVQFQLPCMERLHKNLSSLRISSKGLACSVPRVHGAWQANLRLDTRVNTEDLAVSLIEDLGVRTFPGSFFGYFEHSPVLVISLLVAPEIFQEGIGKLFSHPIFH